ncbi:MAG: alanine:cation symporter family protein [Clostridia bacterium]|nr:alanine:cation symporter family protein [Clostridia bacterium]
MNKYLSIVLIPLLITAGIYFTLRTKFVQIRLFKDSIKSLFHKPKTGSVSPFQSLMISMASRIGVGQIAGITLAIVAGGPGAIFWMWIMAVLGCTSAFVESTLAQIYKVKNKDGSFRGGPAYYISKAMHKKYLGIIFACLLIGGYAYGFNMLQSYQLSSSLEYYIDNYNNTIYPLLVGLGLAVVTALVIWGGTHRIAFISEYIVPIMSIAYVMLSIFIIGKNINKVPSVLHSIFSEAFSIRAIMTSPFSAGVLAPLVHGVKRGLFSNEAGMGSAPNAAASADVKHPVNQGLAQLFSVFIDTMLICSSTAFIVLLSGLDRTQKISQILFVQKSVKSQIGSLGVHLIAFAILTFAFTSIIGNYCYAESNVLFIKNNKVVLNIFRVTCVLAVFLGAQVRSNLAWNISDIFMSLMAIMNILVIMRIGKIALKALDDYIKQKKQGKLPEFKAKDIGLEDTDVWN